MRYDRVLARKMAPVDIRILGRPDHPASLLASDHFGLSADVEVVHAEEADSSFSFIPDMGLSKAAAGLLRPVSTVSQQVLGLPVAVLRPVMKFRLGFGLGSERNVNL